jgi:hypothetical protein
MLDRVNFLNWRPDLDETVHDGMVTVENVVHEVDGYKPLNMQTSAGFSTTGGLAASLGTITSVVARPVGSQDDLFCAWLATVGTITLTSTLHVGLNGVTATTTVTGYPLSNVAVGLNGAITAFDVCEIKDKIFFTVRADFNTGGPLDFSGYMDF